MFTALSCKIDPMRVDKKNLAKRTFGPSFPQFDRDGSFISMQLETPMIKVAAPGSKPSISEFLYACGLKEIITAGTSVRYEPQTPSDVDAAQSSTAEAYIGGIKYKLIGMRGNFTLSGSPKDGLNAKFDLSAPYIQPTPDSAAPSALPYPGNVMTFSTATAVLANAQPIDIGQFEFSLNAEIVKDVSSSGVTVFLLNHKPTLKINPYAVATKSDWQSLLESELFSFSASFNNGAFVLSAPNVALIQSNPKDRAGRISNEQEFECFETSGDDQFSMTFS
ncbi:MAG: hypothetical protein HQL99_14180 [Magnetococcales bacterium]|nr:hypothetical protein [Magnetococcales bacterium]